MKFVIRRTGPRLLGGYLVGLGGSGRNLTTPHWELELDEAQRFDTTKGALEHAKMLFPAAVSQKWVHIEEVEE